MADVNVGVITTIWSVQPLIAAVLDYFIYSEKLMRFHLVGMVMIVAGAIAIGYSSNEKENLMVDVRVEEQVGQVIVDPKAPKWIAILFGFIAPCFMLA